MTKIVGITFSVPNTVPSLYSNGIRQNVLYFNQLVNQLPYEVYLVCDKPLIPGIPVFDYAKYKHCIYNSEEYNNISFDIMIQMGLTLSPSAIERLRNKKCKVILYKCGNEYIFEMEQALFASKELSMPAHAEYGGKQMIDQVWTIPQMKDSCTDYFSIRYRAETKIVPFIWSPVILEQLCSTLNNKGLYDKEKQKEKKEYKIAIFEPNLNVVKYGIPPLYICENAYRKRKDKQKIKNVYITNAHAKSGEYGKFNSKQFSRMTYSLDLYADKKISIESRYNAVVFMNLHADICVSHQWENPLNYLYLDLAWMGWPVLHNAHLCKDVGYYYEHFDFEHAGDTLNYILDTHPIVSDDYLEYNRSIISRYLNTNPENIAAYHALFEQL